MICTSDYISPIGNITIADRSGNIIGAWIENQKYFAESIHEDTCTHETPAITQAKNWFEKYFAGLAPDTAGLPVRPEGTAFRCMVWKIISQIPYGMTTSYQAIAEKVFPDRSHMSCQAVGNAVSHNPVSIIIPCHRVIGKSGDLTGYAGGTDKKMFLLRLEKADAGIPCFPKN